MTERISVSSDERLVCQGRLYRCALGPKGVGLDKREGDGLTPTGTFPLREVLYRADRLERPETALPTRALRPDDGWCTDSSDPMYNRLVTLPYPASHESLWREDRVYDIIVILGYNDDPPVPGKGSAIFFHLAREDYAPTEGCVAVSLSDMLEILKGANKNTTLEVGE